MPRRLLQNATRLRSRADKILKYRYKKAQTIWAFLFWSVVFNQCLFQLSHVCRHLKVQNLAALTLQWLICLIFFVCSRFRYYWRQRCAWVENRCITTVLRFALLRLLPGTSWARGEKWQELAISVKSRQCSLAEASQLIRAFEG